MFIVIVLIVVGVVGALVVYGQLRRRRENETPQERADRLQRNAKTFASRLVSDLKLHNKALVADGTLNHDLYHQLQNEIDRARMMYDSAQGSMADHDYFHEAVVEILCDGDADVLGEGYPGPRAHTIQ